MHLENIDFSMYTISAFSAVVISSAERTGKKQYNSRQGASAVGVSGLLDIQASLCPPRFVRGAGTFFHVEREREEFNSHVKHFFLET